MAGRRRTFWLFTAFIRLLHILRFYEGEQVVRRRRVRVETGNNCRWCVEFKLGSLLAGVGGESVAGLPL